MSGVRAGRPEAAAAIWTWKEGRAGAEASASELRIGGAVRAAIGVVFQSPSVDRMLSVAENLRHQGRLYGLGGSSLATRIDELLNRFGLAARAGERVARLSGGLRRRVELAKGMLHDPSLLLLDEPSTGLDPAARGDLWQELAQVREDRGVTVVLTTHLLDEAERAERIAILDAGRLVALDATWDRYSQKTDRRVPVVVLNPSPAAGAR